MLNQLKFDTKVDKSHFRFHENDTIVEDIKSYMYERAFGDVILKPGGIYYFET